MRIDGLSALLPKMGTVPILLAVCVAAAVARADEVTLVDGTKIAGCTVVTENAKEVVINTPSRTIPSEQVESVVYAERPLDYRQAEIFFKSGTYERAVTGFKAIADSVKTPAWVPVHAAYYRAVALQRWAESQPDKAAEAVLALNDFVTRFGTSRFIYEARLALAQAYMVQNQPNDVKKLAEAIVQEKPNTRWGQTARLMLARVKVQQNDAAGAEKDYSAALADMKDTRSEVWAQATVGRGLALLALNRVAEAEKILEDLIEATDDGRLRAQAYNGLGDAYFKKGDYASARLKFLRVVLLYGKADPAEHAKALYYAAECFRQLGEEGRANELFRELVGQYPGTPWAAKSPVKPAAEGGGPAAP